MEIFTPLPVCRWGGWWRSWPQTTQLTQLRYSTTPPAGRTWRLRWSVYSTWSRAAEQGCRLVINIHIPALSQIIFIPKYPFSFPFLFSFSFHLFHFFCFSPWNFFFLSFPLFLRLLIIFFPNNPRNHILHPPPHPRTEKIIPLLWSRVSLRVQRWTAGAHHYHAQPHQQICQRDGVLCVHDPHLCVQRGGLRGRQHGGRWGWSRGNVRRNKRYVESAGFYFYIELKDMDKLVKSKCLSWKIQVILHEL